MNSRQEDALVQLEVRCPEIARLIRKGPIDRTSFIPALKETEHLLGYVPADCLDLIAESLDVPKAEAEWLALTIAQVSLAAGSRNVIRVCRGPNCTQNGSARILSALKSVTDSIDPDGSCLDIGTTTCLGACSEGPNMLLDGMLLTHNTEESVSALARRLCGLENPENP